MAERLKLEPEVQEILSHIDNGENFLLSGGAGSGKTYSLVQVIKQIISENSNVKIACITYTNAAVKEIEERVNHKNLNVSTIHDFLWDNIRHFQKELKSSLIFLINDEESKIKNPEDESIPDSYFDKLEDGIQYKEYLKLKDGIISHDEVPILANHIFKNYPKICDILKDKFKYILIDEYQDTNKNVVEILLVHLKQSKKLNTIGFFGDAMQSIYDDGIGNLNEYKGSEDGKVKEVDKKQNRRNPKLIIELANKLRTDGITQTPSMDLKAPNMLNGVIKDGDIKFYYSSSNDLEEIKKQIGWDFKDNKQTKILNLTHNLIAPKAGFENLMNIYDRDPIFKLKSEILKKIKDNKKDNKPEVQISENDTFDQVVDKFQLKDRGGNLKKVILLGDAVNCELFNQLKDLPFTEVRKIYLDKDSLIDDKKQNRDDESKKGSKRDDLIKHLFKIQNNISLYSSGQFNDFIRTTDYMISSIADKIELKKRIIELTEVGDKTIEELIDKADEYGVSKKDDKVMRFIKEKEYIYNRIKKIKFSEFQNLFNYLEGYTPFSTQHKTKGTEFDNVLVILDNGGWNSYNFQGLFENNNSESVGDRTKKIFYVCCTRAKENLAVFYYNPTQSVVNKANDWFGESNVISII